MFDSLFSIRSTRECSFQGAEESVKDEVKTGRLSSSFLTLHSVQTSKRNFVSDFSITTVESKIPSGVRSECTVPTIALLERCGLIMLLALLSIRWAAVS